MTRPAHPPTPKAHLAPHFYLPFKIYGPAESQSLIWRLVFFLWHKPPDEPCIEGEYDGPNGRCRLIKNGGMQINLHATVIKLIQFLAAGD